MDLETRAIPDGTDEQAAVAFANVRWVLAAAGGTAGDIDRQSHWLDERHHDLIHDLGERG
jgi:hypothetical protein